RHPFHGAGHRARGPLGRHRPHRVRAPRGAGDVSASDRGQTPAGAGFVIWLTGLSAAGKSTIGWLVADELEARGLLVDRLDGDGVREHRAAGLGFSKEDRDTNIARIGWVASRLARAGAAVIVSAISPYEEARRRARALTEEHAVFVEVYVATSLEEC